MSVEVMWGAQDEAWRCYDHIPIICLTAPEVMAAVDCGSAHPWPTEVKWLWSHHTHEMLRLLNSVIAEGFRSPIIIGDDGRLWDGHHRLAVALALGIKVPTRTVEADDRGLAWDKANPSLKRGQS